MKYPSYVMVDSEVVSVCTEVEHEDIRKVVIENSKSNLTIK